MHSFDNAYNLLSDDMQCESLAVEMTEIMEMKIKPNM
jgi:hypothetical protein